MRTWSNFKYLVFIPFLFGWIIACHQESEPEQNWHQIIERNKLLASEYENFYRIIAETTTAAEGTMAQAKALHDKSARMVKMEEAIAEANPRFLQQLATFQPRMDSIETQRQRLVSRAGADGLKEAQQNSELARRLASESHMNLINPLGTVKQAIDLCDRIDKLLADAEYTLEEAAKRLDKTNQNQQ
ncbi:MAG TPA: hypothetical protein P5275_18755 [Saprospiraceae bacterium]|nr:hypothetical protein [Saprospiraceae bacterium]HPG07015.1 hypothetical protein [Saprospiraceae bacterium]HRV86921.1 hypothetical protein [Saprospiraceae bacterium]